MVAFNTLVSLLPLLVQAVQAQTAGRFSLLSYNVAGLPAFLSGNGVPGDKATNARTIGTKLAQGGYDVVHLQEDFNYHSSIYATDNHPQRTATSGGVPFGSGLNTVANFGWSSFNRITWDQCWVNEADCLTPKGFTFMRMQLASGVEVDLYNLHADAGDDALDAIARRAGIQQLLAYINSNSAGRAVIIGGDCNDRYTTAASQRSINLLLEAGFTDSWIERIKGGVVPAAGSPANGCGVPAANNNCEVVDKVLYRSGSSVKLSTLQWSYHSNIFVQPDGNKLSDHNPVFVEFAWSTAA